MSYQGIDYTFRNTLNNLITNQKANNISKDNKNNTINIENNTDIERIRRKNNLKIQQHISDLENTVSLNQECINNMIPLLQLNQTQKNKLIASIKKITNYFNDKKAYRKKKNEINSKMLINKQIIEEIKRRRDEGYLMYKEQTSNLSESVTKKTSLVKQFQKKFSEVEIFIQRESQTDEHIEKYGKWKTFTVIPFMKRNEDILKKKCFYEEEVNKKKKEIENLEKENGLLKYKNEININNINDTNIIKEYYEKIMDINKKENELMKCYLNIISENNFKKEIIPTFKSKNPIVNLDIDVKLFEPKKAQNIEIVEQIQEIAPPIEDNWLDPEKEGNISDIEIEK
jgi:hypothetical protein